MEYIIAVVIAVFLASLPVVKGFTGNIITWFTMKGLKKDVYSVFNHVNVTKKDGSLYQIDQVIVSKYGIFVVKKMSISGSIFGDEKMKEWTQIILASKKKFPNPIIENKKNLTCLVANLEEHKKKFISMISFSNKGILKKVITTTPVLLSLGVARGVKYYDKVLLTDTEVENIKKKLSEMI